jgi:hypothetical protein
MSLSREREFFQFMGERERIRLRKEADLPYPWTDDSILRSYKFTNVRRQHDKTSRLLREEFYTPHYYNNPVDILMNCALFRYFGTIEFARAVGWQTHENFDFEGIKETARVRLANRERVFTGAYVITNQGISAPKQEVVVDTFLKGLHGKAHDLVRVVSMTRRWRDVSELMRTLMGFGGSGFMTKEILLDTMYSNLWGGVSNGMTFPADYWEWTPIGPGARRGAARVLGDPEAKPLSESKALSTILWLTNGQDLHTELDFKLSPTDVQFQLCEFDKYERVRLGQGRPRSKYHVPS